jgi:hypothetical protein
MFPVMLFQCSHSNFLVFVTPIKGFFEGEHTKIGTQRVLLGGGGQLLLVLLNGHHPGQTLLS